MTESRDNVNSSFVDFAGPILEAEVDQNSDITPPSPIGAVLFDGNKQLLLVGESSIGRLRIVTIPTPEGFNRDQLVSGRGRVIELNHLAKIAAYQIDLPTSKIQTTESVHSNFSTVSARLRYLENDDKPRAKDIDEGTLLRVFTREQGGILAFRGGGLPEETAMIIEQQVDSQRRYGQVFFFHDHGGDRTINSINGLSTFLTTLREEFVSHVPLKNQTETLNQIGEIKRAGGIGQLSRVRNELFLAVMIANARLFDLTGDNKYGQLLEQFVPQYKTEELSFWQKLIKSWGPPEPPIAIDYTSKVDAVINSVLIGQESISLEKRQPTQTLITEEALMSRHLEGRLNKLKTRWAKRARVAIHPSFNRTDRIELLDIYRDQLRQYVANAKSVDDCEDLEFLLEELKSSSFINHHRAESEVNPLDPDQDLYGMDISTKKVPASVNLESLIKFVLEEKFKLQTKDPVKDTWSVL